LPLPFAFEAKRAGGKTSLHVSSSHHSILSCFAHALQKSVQGSPESASSFAKSAFQLSAGGAAVGMPFALYLSA